MNDLPWWFNYIPPIAGSVLLAFALGATWLKRIFGTIALSLMFLLINITEYDSNYDVFICHSFETRIHAGPPNHWYKVPPTP